MYYSKFEEELSSLIKKGKSSLVIHKSGRLRELFITEFK